MCHIGCLAAIVIQLTAAREVQLDEVQHLHRAPTGTCHTKHTVDMLNAAGSTSRYVRQQYYVMHVCYVQDTTVTAQVKTTQTVPLTHCFWHSKPRMQEDPDSTSSAASNTNHEKPDVQDLHSKRACCEQKTGADHTTAAHLSA